MYLNIVKHFNTDHLFLLNVYSPVVFLVLFKIPLKYQYFQKKKLWTLEKWICIFQISSQTK